MWGVIGPSCEDIQILPAGYRITAKLLPLSMPQFSHLNKERSYLLVPSHLKAFTFRCCSLNALSPTHSRLPMAFREVCSDVGFQRGPVQQPCHSAVRPQSSSAALTSLHLTGPQRSSHEFLWSQRICHPLSRQGPALSLSQTRPIPRSQPNGFHFPENYSNELITPPMETRAHPSLLSLQSLPPIAPAGSLCFQVPAPSAASLWPCVACSVLPGATSICD